MMLQSGLLVSCSPESEFGIFKQLMIHIGDTQSLEFELSTYSSHLMNMKYFMENANGKTLFFIDELGSGSDPNLGGAFAEVWIRGRGHRFPRSRAAQGGLPRVAPGRVQRARQPLRPSRHARARLLDASRHGPTVHSTLGGRRDDPWARKLRREGNRGSDGGGCGAAGGRRRAADRAAFSRRRRERIGRRPGGRGLRPQGAISHQRGAHREPALHRAEGHAKSRSRRDRSRRAFRLSRRGSERYRGVARYHRAAAPASRCHTTRSSASRFSTSASSTAAWRPTSSRRARAPRS